jgi:CRISPR type III-A-associated protein Csm2
MSDEVQPEIEKVETAPEPQAEAPPAEAAKAEPAPEAPAKAPVNLEALVKKASTKDFTRPRGDSGTAPRPERGPERGDKPRGENRGGGGGNRPGGENRGGDRGPRPERGGERGGERREGGRPNFGGGGGRPFDGPVDIELEKLISDSLYLDNQAHVVVMRMRDMDSGTKSQLRRLYNAVRRAVRAPESERQHQFVMLRARLAYTIARHSLRSLDALERLLLQVTRKNDVRGYERFKDLFEAIVAYNE